MLKKVFWVSSPCNLENWFVIADDDQEAALFHDYAEGFNPGYSNAKMVCVISTHLVHKYKIKEASWPTLDLLKELGFEVIEEDSPRVISYQGVIYYEGGSVKKMLENQSYNKGGVYVINIKDTNKYKIGYSKNLEARLKSFRTGSPFKINLTHQVITRHYKSLEKHLHELFKYKRVRGEWFTFQEEDLNKLEDIFNYLNTQSDEFEYKPIREWMNNYRYDI